MSLQVLLAHAGVRLAVDPSIFSSLDAFKSWLAEGSSIAPARQILLTASGKQAKGQALLVEREIFVYDRELISSKPKEDVPSRKPAPEDEAAYIPAPPPDTLADQNDLRAWHILYDERRQWATGVAQGSRAVANKALKDLDGCQIVRRGLMVALGNLQSHVRSLEQKHGEATSWLDGVRKEHDNMFATCKDILSSLEHLPANKAFLRLLPALGLETSQGESEESESGNTLDIFVAPENLAETNTQLLHIQQSLQSAVDKIGSDIDLISHDASDLTRRIEKRGLESLNARHNDTRQLLEEIDVVAKKVRSDYEHVIRLPVNAKSLSQVSKMALLHTRNYLPSMVDYVNEMNGFSHGANQDRTNDEQYAVGALREIATIEARFAVVSGRLQKIDVQDDGAKALDHIALLSQLPWVYGTLLIEAVRRREWSDRLRDESAILAEDIAGYREEEEKRRKKWFKTIGNMVSEDLVFGKALDFELNIHAEDHEWPHATREDVHAYIQALQPLKNMQETIADLTEAVKELDRPTKRQIKKARGFKMGSFHEAASLKGSFLLRENDEIRVLKDSSVKLEEELKSQKSRVRKLEDLLHRQSQSARPSSANLFQTPTYEVQGESMESPLSKQPSQDELSRKSSLNQVNRRLSDERSLARRIVSLEAELIEERNRRQTMEKEVEAKREIEARVRSEVDEALSTKKDLLKNLEAQKREFDNERSLLEQESKVYKVRIEEMEDEVDRVLGSRDHERMLREEKLSALEVELTNVKKENASLAARDKERDDSYNDTFQTLQAIHQHLSPSKDSPNTYSDLVNVLDVLVERSGRHLKELEAALALTHADKDALQAGLERQDKAMLQCKDQMKEFESETSMMRADLGSERAKSMALVAELEDARKQLKELRRKFADGETGSETLRQRVEDQAARASGLATELAKAKSHVNSLDVELSAVQRKYQSAQTEAYMLARKLEARSARDREMTSRLVNNNQDLRKLLENLGLSIIGKEGAMNIQRTSKLTGASTDNLQNSIMTGSMGAASVLMVGQALDTNPEAHLLQWMQADTDAAEAHTFKEFMAKIDLFDYSTFCEAILKLRRDIEWTGKKWKNEARNYREKCRQSQAESSEKIALRSFKEGDLALFLPTRNQATRPWAAFNIGAPHYFLREQESHKLQTREWLVARISKVQERVVNLSKTIDSLKASDGRSIGEDSESKSLMEDDNPFELSDGLRWYLLEAAEEKGGAPSTPGLGKTTVASANVDARGSIRVKKTFNGTDASSKLNRNLTSRRSSTSSKRASFSEPPSKDSGLEVNGRAANAVLHVRAGSHDSVSASSPNHEEHLSTSPQPGRRPSAIEPAVSSSKSSGWQQQSDKDGMQSRAQESQLEQYWSPHTAVPVPKSVPTSPTKPKVTAWETLFSLDLNRERGKRTG